MKRTTYICDRCNSEHKSVLAELSCNTTSKKVDICNDCLILFDSWMQNRKIMQEITRLGQEIQPYDTDNNDNPLIHHIEVSVDLFLKMTDSTIGNGILFTIEEWDEIHLLRSKAQNKEKNA